MPSAQRCTLGPACLSILALVVDQPAAKRAVLEHLQYGQRIGPIADSFSVLIPPDLKTGLWHPVDNEPRRFLGVHLHRSQRLFRAVIEAQLTDRATTRRLPVAVLR